MRMREPIEWEVDSSLSESDLETADLRSFDPDPWEAKRIIFDCIQVEAIVTATRNWIPQYTDRSKGDSVSVG